MYIRDNAGNPIHTGNPLPARNYNEARTSNITAVSNGGVVSGVATTIGVQVQKPYSIPELEWSYAAAAGGILVNTDVAIKAAAGTGIRNYITSIQIQNIHATVATEVVIKDGTTVIWRGFAPAAMTSMLEINFNIPLKTTANTALNFQCVTTGAQVYVNAQGYAAP